MADRIMDHAQLLVQTVGYDGFSYADIALELGIRNATIHYYFPGKADLCRRLLQRYRSRFRNKVAQAMVPIGAPRRRLELYLSFYQEALADGRLCPCGVLTTELAHLSPEVQAEVREFFEEQIEWVAVELERARILGEVASVPSPHQMAVSLFGMIEGGMLLSRSMGNAGLMCDSAQTLLALIFRD